MYSLDGIDFKEYGIYVSGSDGIVDRPKMRYPDSVTWDEYPGESIYRGKVYCDVREITLSCFIKAESKMDFMQKITSFEQLFDKPGTHRLVIDVHPDKPLVYEVYCKDSLQITKEWTDDIMTGTFNLKLIEPEPVKRVLRYNAAAQKNVAIKLSSEKCVNIFWGDGYIDFDIYGEERTITHKYTDTETYLIVITGDIDAITAFETTAETIWNKI